MGETEDSAAAMRRIPDIQAVSRVGQILTLFAPQSTELASTEIADRLDLNRTTAYRYCMSLVGAGLLERGSSGGFIPGALLMQLGALALGRRDVVDLAPPHMRELARRTGLTSVLGLWGTSGAVVSRIEEDTASGLLVTVRVGTQLSLDTAQSHLFLAFNHDQLQVDRLMANLPGADRDKLIEKIDYAREHRFAFHEGAGMSGIAVIAAPVFADYGICAAIALIGTDKKLPLTMESNAATLLVDSARRLSEELGGS